MTGCGEPRVPVAGLRSREGGPWTRPESLPPPVKRGIRPRRGQPAHWGRRRREIRSSRPIRQIRCDWRRSSEADRAARYWRRRRNHRKEEAHASVIEQGFLSSDNELVEREAFPGHHLREEGQIRKTSSTISSMLVRTSSPIIRQTAKRAGSEALENRHDSGPRRLASDRISASLYRRKRRHSNNTRTRSSSVASGSAPGWNAPARRVGGRAPRGPRRDGSRADVLQLPVR